MKILLTVFFFTVLINSLFANNLSNRECNELASEVNSALSNMHIDKVTIFENAFCPSNAKLIYNYKLTQDISQSEFEEVIADLKTKNITVWVIITLILIALFNVFESSSDKGGGNVIAYSDFLERVESGEIYIYIE